jgi:hypothetical protein
VGAQAGALQRVGAQADVSALQWVGAQAGTDVPQLAVVGALAGVVSLAGVVPMSELSHGVMAEESLNQQIHCHALLSVLHHVCICIF